MTGYVMLRHVSSCEYCLGQVRPVYAKLGKVIIGYGMLSEGVRG